ncbi:MAG TPA: hypothetical protein VJ351_01080 [Streptosporangiaceae bacterium]|nr:hypothetical protein [Streptosporangiaceae bacterium]
MSEYQYYEFLALDRPLTDKQRAELRSISTRAEITATRFVNEYQWGDFKGDPRKLMERYFDAFLYLANWGTRRLMFRLPRGVLDSKTAERYCYTDTASLIETGSHLILSLYVDREPDDYWDQPGGQLAAMVQARAELAAGDLRLLYLAWLLALQSDEVDDEDTEPPVPAGLEHLSASLQAVVEFFEIDEDLIAVAAASSPSIQDPEGMAGWITSLPAEQKDALLARVAAGEGAQVRALLLRRFRTASGSPPTAPARTAAELWQAAGNRKAARAKAAERSQRQAEARTAAAQAASYAKHLDQLATHTEAAWEKAAEWIETKRPRDYDLAVSLLRDLQALADRQEDPAAFRKRFLDLRAEHQRKPSLLDRFDQAGLPS